MCGTQPSLHCHSPVPEVMHLVSYNHCAAYSNSFLPHTILDWNALAMDLLLFQTVDAFKNYLFTDPSSHHFRFYLDYFLSAGNVAYPAAVRLSSLRRRTLSRRWRWKI